MEITPSGGVLFNNQAEKRSNVNKIYELYIALGNFTTTSGANDIINLVGDKHYHFKVVGIVRGFWEDNPQDTLLVQVSDTETALEQTVQKLKEHLDTDEVWMQDILDTFEET